MQQACVRYRKRDQVNALCDRAQQFDHGNFVKALRVMPYRAFAMLRCVCLSQGGTCLVALRGKKIVFEECGRGDVHPLFIRHPTLMMNVARGRGDVQC